jgi:hypothetical protein|tara:strand:+ start:3142 stop:3582 length:441 start_codon:yes stop_codon:yes gene_type:complete
MATFASIDKNNKVVQVTFVDNALMLDDDNVERPWKGVHFLQNAENVSDGVEMTEWIQTSCNTKGGKHYDPETGKEDLKPPIRMNYATVGDTYDRVLDIFIPFQPYDSWTLNETTYQWEAPISFPEDGKEYLWNEETTSWDLEDLGE